VNSVSRTDSYLSILDAAAKIQYNVTLILEVKALHAEKSRNWICNHLSVGAYSSNLDQVKQTVNIHEQLIQTHRWDYQSGKFTYEKFGDSNRRRGKVQFRRRFRRFDGIRRVREMSSAYAFF
jgi:hypothetical protein